MRWLLIILGLIAFSVAPAIAAPAESTEARFVQVDPAARAVATTEAIAAAQSSIMQTGSARIIIGLRESSSTRMSDGRANPAEIALLQNAVISSVQSSLTRNATFNLGHVYSHVPAFSAEVGAEALAELNANPLVEYIEMNLPTQAHLLESVPAINADDVHNLGFRGAGVRVAVLDTGIPANHPDINHLLIAQKCFTAGNCAPSNTNESNSALDINLANNGLGSGHGTNVTGIIVADGVVSPRGFAPDASHINVRVLDGNGSGWVDDWIAGLNWLIANDATLKTDVINMSLGTFSLYNGSCEAQQTTTHNVIQQLVQVLGVVIFASSGNQGSSTSISSPACLPSVIAVGATYDSDMGREPDSGTYQTSFGSSFPACFDATSSLNTVTCFSNSNAMVDIYAPGRRIQSAGLTANTSTFSGTSMASPTAAGVAALLLEYAPFLTPVQVETTLENTGIAVTDPKNGVVRPRIDALAALTNLTNANMISNGQFASAIGSSARNWGTFALPNPDSIQWNTSGGVFNFYRPAGSTTGVVLQSTQHRIPKSSTLKIDLTLGNTMNERQRVTVLAHDADFSDLQVCSFWLPPNSTQRLYQMLFQTTEYWTDVTLSVYAATTRTTGSGYIQLDNVSMRLRPDLATQNIYCYDPEVPSPVAAANGPEMITDGSFTIGAIGNANSGWGVFTTPNHDTEWQQNIAYQVSGGVFEFYRKNRTLPPGEGGSAVVLQYTQDSVPNRTILDATFQLGNSTPNRARITAIVHTRNFIDLFVCTFWLPANTPLNTYRMVGYSSVPWDNASGNDATISFYNATAHASGWLRVDNVSLITSPSTQTEGTNCYQPGIVFPIEARVDPALVPDLLPTATPGGAPYVAPNAPLELPLVMTPTPTVEPSTNEGSVGE